MPQKFANRAKSLLQTTINAAATSLVVASADADEFPVADTGTDPVNTAGKDWFKLVLIDTSGNYEIMYARSRTLGSGTISNIIRGQDGTTAIGFNAGSFVVQDFVAEDLNDLLAEQASQATSIADRVTKAEIQNQTYTAFSTGGTGSAYTLNAVPDAATYAANQAFDVTFHAASSGTPTIAVDAQSAKSLMYMNSAGAKVTVGTLIPANWRSKIIYDGTDFIVQAMPVVVTPILRNHMSGFICSTPGSSTTLTISEGQCADSTNSVYMSLAVPLAKTTAAWVAGAGGGMDVAPSGGSCTGASCTFSGTTMTCTVAPSAGTWRVGQVVNIDNQNNNNNAAAFPKQVRLTALGTGTGGTGTYTLDKTTSIGGGTYTTSGTFWYNVYAIRNPNTGAVDTVFSLAPTFAGVTATLIPAFTQSRWIGVWPLTATAAWRGNKQVRRLIYVQNPVAEYFMNIARVGQGSRSEHKAFVLPPDITVQATCSMTANASTNFGAYAVAMNATCILDAATTAQPFLGYIQAISEQLRSSSAVFSVRAVTQAIGLQELSGNADVYCSVQHFDISEALGL